MIDQLKELDETNTIIIINDDIIDFAETDQSKIVSVKICSVDDNEFVILELEDLYIVSHNFDIDPRYYVYQIMDSGSIEDLEQDGYFFLTEEMEFRSKIVNKEDNKTHIYKYSDVGAVYELAEDNCDNPIESICEYNSSSHHLSNMLVIKYSDETLLILQGFEVFEEDLEIE